MMGNFMGGFWGNGLGLTPLLTDARSRSISAENPSGEKGSGGKAVSALGTGRKGRAFIPLPQGKTVVLADIQGTGVIEHIWLTVAEKTHVADFVLRDLVLRMYWDSEETPSVEVPLGDFFCCGFGARCLVNSLPIVVAPTGGMNCYFPMPFGSRARVTITNEHPADIEAFFYQIDYALLDELPERTGYLHAQWRRQQLTNLAADYVILDGVRGSGKYVGTYLAIAALQRYWWGEGEVKFFIDGDQEWPTICGTGTEDYFGGAWSFQADPPGDGPQIITYCSPYLGYPYHSAGDNTRTNPYTAETVPMHGLYRWHLPDPIHFNQDLRVTVQQIGHDGQALFERRDDVSSVAYWYQLEPHAPFPPPASASDRRPR